MRFNGGKSAVRRLPPWLIPVIGYAVAIGCLVWVYRGFDWREQYARVRAVEWHWVAIAALADIAVYITQGWRWNVLVRPVGQLPVIRSVQAIYIGLFANEVLPLRPGEVIRCFLQARWAHMPISVSLSSAAVERVLDGIWLMLGFYVASYFVELPPVLEYGGRILTGVLIVASFLLVLAALHKEHAKNMVNERGWSAFWHHLIDALHDMARSRSFLAAVALSFFYLALQVVPVYAVMRAYELDLSMSAAAIVTIILRLGSILPQAPGNVGSFQVLTVTGLRLFGIEKGLAAGYATFLFIVITVPLWVVGFVALIATRLRLDELHRTAHSETSRQSTPTPR
jgi:hypothetical protein